MKTVNSMYTETLEEESSRLLPNHLKKGDMIKLFTPISNEDDSNLLTQKTESTELELVPLFSKIEDVPTANEKPLIPIFKKVLFNKIEASSPQAVNASVIPQTMNASSLQALKELKTTSAEEKTDEDYGNFKLSLHKKIIEIAGNKPTENAKTFYLFKILVDEVETYWAKVPGSQIDSLNWIVTATGGAAYLDNEYKNRQKLIKIIHSMISQRNYGITRIFSTNGWKKIENNWRYVIQDGIVGQPLSCFQGDCSTPFHYKKEEVGTFATFQNAVNMTKICHDESTSLPLWLFTHIGCLDKLFELANFPIKGVMAVVGATNSRKTSMALCLTKTFRRENISSPDITFDSTPGGLEIWSSRYADSVLLIDDFHPTMTKKGQNKLFDNLEFILRRYGDRVAKQRMTDYNNSDAQSSYAVTGVCVITGEDIGGVQSSLTRVLSLEINRDTVNNNVLSYYQKNPLILTNHLYAFITYVTTKFSHLVEYIEKRVFELRKTKSYSIPRFSEYYAQLMTTAEIICKYAFENKFWDSTMCQKWLLHCEEIIDHIIKKNLVDIEREDFALIVMQALKYIIEKNGILKLEDICNHRLLYNEIAEDSEFIYIQADFLLEATKKYWQQLGKDLPFSSKKQLGFFLEQKGLILVKKEGDDVRRTLPIPRGKQRVLYVKKDKMSELLTKVEV